MKIHLHHFSKIKIQKESQNGRNQGFSYYFCMMIEGSGSGSIRQRYGSGSCSGSGSFYHHAKIVPLINGSGSGSWRPTNTWIRWIRIRIRNTGPSYRRKNIKHNRTRNFLTFFYLWILFADPDPLT